MRMTKGEYIIIFFGIPFLILAVIGLGLLFYYTLEQEPETKIIREVKIQKVPVEKPMVVYRYKEVPQPKATTIKPEVKEQPALAKPVVAKKFVDIALANNGLVYLTDRQAGKLVQLNGEGKELKAIEVPEPAALAVADSFIYLLENKEKTIKIYNLDLELLYTSAPLEFQEATDLEVLEKENEVLLYVSDPASPEKFHIFKIAPWAKSERAIAQPRTR